MESPIHVDSSTDVEDSSTEGSDNGINDTSEHKTTTVKTDERLPHKRPAESLPSEVPTTKQPKLQLKSTAKPAKDTVDALSFLKSRPQIAAMGSAHKTHNNSKASQAQQSAPGEQGPSTGHLSGPESSSRAVVADSTGNKTSVEQIEDFYTSNRFEGKASAWQHHETIDEFLRRLPVADPAIAAKREGSSEAFIEAAKPVLAGFEKQRAILEQQNPGKAVATITRKMGPYRDQLEVDLMNTAEKLHLTSGKWMLFPAPEHLPLVWRRVAEATAEGKLDPISKAGTFEPGRSSTVICVYTYDFSDLADIKRVLQCLVDLDIRQKLYYKCDAYTYLHIDSKNKYKLQASLYSSEEVLRDRVRYEDGLIVRLKASKVAMEDFLTS